MPHHDSLFDPLGRLHQRTEASSFTAQAFHQHLHLPGGAGGGSGGSSGGGGDGGDSSSGGGSRVSG